MSLVASCHVGIVRKTKEFTYNYVDRVRLAESSLQDHKCPTRGSGWRHNKSISHLDLATSCHSAASGLNHWSQSRQLRHSRSLDYNHIDIDDRCKDALDIAEFYWRIDPEADNYEDVPLPEQRSAALNHSNSNNNNNNNSNEQQQHYRDYNYADENYHSTNSIYQQHLATGGGSVPLQAFDFGSESCSLRRSRSLAVIREETFSDLQITSANSSRRRSQLIPRARLVNRGYFRERERFITCGNNKHHHHHHNSNNNNNSTTSSRIEKLTNGTGSSSGGVGAEQEGHSNEGSASTCDSHQHQHRHHHHHHEGVGGGGGHQSREADNYYDNLKRLDALAVGLAEQLHPWHSDKSDLESLNSDYFKNSLHQSHELKQQLDLEALEQAVNLLTAEKPRIYQSRRQQRGGTHHNERLNSTTHQKLHAAAAAAASCGPDSCPENSQSSLFPETTTSNSDDQTDSPSLSEQEYDITKIEEIFQQTHLEGDEESYELISLTTTTRTRIETTEDEEEVEDDTQLIRDQQRILLVEGGEEDEHSGESNEHTTTDTEVEGTLKRTKVLSENLEKLIAYDCVYLSSEEGSESTLVDDNCETVDDKQTLTANLEDVDLDETSTLLHISIEDNIYEKHHHYIQQHNGVDTLDHLEEKDVQIVEQSFNTEIELLEQQKESKPTSLLPNEPILYTQILRVEHTPTTTTTTTNSIITAAPTGVTSSVASKPKILSVVEKRKLKRYTDATAYSSSESGTQRAALEHIAIAHGYQPTVDNPFAHLKRQATDSLYIPFTGTLVENQYHSLPDINIGQSLKVSECIDAKLRSSYNLNQYQRTGDDDDDDDEVTVNVGNRLSETKTKTLIHENHNTVTGSNISKQTEAIVTSEEIYDSIKRFGRAHQKARQKEYQELNDVVEKETKKKEVVLREKRTKVDTSETEILKVCKPSKTITRETTTEITAQETSAPVEHTCQAEVVVGGGSGGSGATANLDNLPVTQYFPEEDIVVANTKQEVEEIPHATDDFEYRENPKEAPNIEVANFSKQIERRAKEIKDSARQTKRTSSNKLEQRFEGTTFATATFRTNKSTTTTHNFPKATDTADIPSVVASQNGANQFRIIVTDTQNNIIEEDSIDGNCGESLNLAEPEAQKSITVEQPALTTAEHDKENLIKQTSLFVEQRREKHKEKSIIVGSHNRVASLKRVPSKPKRQQYPHQQSCQHISNNSSDSNYSELSAGKSKERRVLSTQIYKARPVKVLAATSDSFRRTAASTAASTTSRKMSRPQILHVVDNKRKSDNVDSGAIISNVKFEGDQAENEYLKKVDAVRCYWSKLAKDEQQNTQQQQQREPEQEPPPHPDHSSETVNEEQPQQQSQQESRQFILGAQESSAKTTTTTADISTRRHDLSQQQDDFSSFMPSIEIVELDGEKKATIVSAVLPNSSNSTDTLSNDASGEPQFDHIRYKVLKSQQLIRSNILARNKKEAQFDGLIQYLQDYSFQELLTNNNVVIVEPVRTKIEQRPLMTNTATTTATNFSALKSGQGTSGSAANTAINQENYSKRTIKDNGVTTAAAAATGKHCGSSGGGGGGIKRHFFYQPVRVNRELYEEELPNPDTVRNVRKFFEKHILPTPGRGLLVRSSHVDEDELEAKENEENQEMLQSNSAATSQQSPKSRRVRKYRYLTIDTSYGHAPQKQQQQQKSEAEVNVGAAQRIGGVAHSRKWETASLSSGISSGDLSSPCECNDTDATASSKVNADAAMSANTELKGVHVQDMVRQHNNKNNAAVFQQSLSSSSAAMAADADNDVVRTIRVPRPRSAIYGPSGESSYYRDIYEYNAGQRYCAPHHHRLDNDDGDADEDADDNDLFADDDDDNDELCESYYVSNDVLEKIRECGSSVTYYGGRVLQNSSNSPDPLLYSNNNGQLGGISRNPHNANARLPHSTMTLTRARAREIETCSVCQPNECPHKQKLQQKFLPRGSNNYSEEISAQKKKTLTKEETDNNKDAYLGIKFKLVKSNSCSSRLELAGAGAEVVYDEDEEDTEVVRKMVHHFESNKKQGGAETNDELLTINNQIPARKVEDHQHSSSARINTTTTTTKPVTVNNHINVPVADDTKDSVRAHTKMHADVAGDKAETDVVVDAAHNQKTFQSSAMDIRLDNGGGGGGNNTGTVKVCRNKNVDLAFTMTKQQQPAKPAGSAKDQTKNQLTQFPVLIDGVGNRSETTMAKMEKQHKQQKAATLNNGTASVSVTSVAKILESNLALKKDQDAQAAGKRITPAVVSQQRKQSLGNSLSAIGEKEKKGMPAMSQIIVPVEIHRAENNTKKEESITRFLPDAMERHSLSTTSSAASLIDKSVGRYYVANDKSLFEKRKYDEIEFEEFEVYDPTKDFDKLIESEEREAHSTTTADGNQRRQQQMQLNHLNSSSTSNNNKSKSPSVSDLSSLNDDDAEDHDNAEQLRVEDGDTKSKCETDCYDSLDDKL